MLPKVVLASPCYTEGQNCGIKGRRYEGRQGIIQGVRKKVPSLIEIFVGISRKHQLKGYIEIFVGISLKHHN